jgi:hypothetical protein
MVSKQAIKDVLIAFLVLQCHQDGIGCKSENPYVATRSLASSLTWKSIVTLFPVFMGVTARNINNPDEYPSR